MESIYQETKYIMKKYKLTADKRLGQNFLVEEQAIHSIVEAAQVTKQDLVIEIGPGLGTLTKYLLEKAGKVIAIELDERMLTILQDRFSFYSQFSVIHKDVLKVDLHALIEKEKQEGKIQTVKIVANLPYYITTPIVMKLLEDKLDIESITIMIQKEVAQRLTAIPGEKNCGAITYSIYYYTEPTEICVVPHDSFIPAPEVDSEVIHLKLRREPVVHPIDEKVFFQVIKAGFLQRRKTIINAFVNGNIVSNKEVAKQMLEALGIHENVRAEELSIEAFSKIADYIVKTRKI